jgi:hypothetical protein
MQPFLAGAFLEASTRREKSFEPDGADRCEHPVDLVDAAACRYGARGTGLFYDARCFVLEFEDDLAVDDRNLGALNNEPMDVDNRGMFYQWGRKDPFMPARSAYHADTDSNNIPAYNETNYEVGNGSGSWIFNATTLPLTTPPGNIPNAIQNPMTYLQPYYSDHYNWYCASKDEKVTHSGLWGPEKTIFDPCPVGYKVPGSNLWGIPSGNTSLRNGGPVEDYDENGVSDKWDWNKAEDCGRRWKNTGDYYPMVGNVYYLSINKTTHNYTGRPSTCLGCLHKRSRRPQRRSCCKHRRRRC